MWARRLLALALAGVTIGLGTGTQTVDTTGAAGATAVNWPWLVVSVVAFIAFVLFERRHQHPLIRLDFFKRPPFAAANIAHFLVGAALIIGMVEIPLYAYTLFGMTEIEGGLLLIRLTLMIPVGAVLGGWLADLVGYRITAVLGFLVSCGGYLLVSRWSLDPTWVTTTRDLMISGLGLRSGGRTYWGDRHHGGGTALDGHGLCLGDRLPHGGDGGGAFRPQFVGSAALQLARGGHHHPHRQTARSDRRGVPDHAGRRRGRHEGSRSHRLQ